MIRHQFGRFLVAGAANTAVTVLLYEGLRRVLPYLVAYGIAYVAGIALAYALGTGYVFERTRTLAGAALFPLVYVAQYLLGTALMWLQVDRLGVDPTAAVLVVVVATIPVTFVLSRRVLAGRG